ncbi:MOSC domain-containing protein [Rhodovibrio salinarum]|uniref:MOSC domain-containing protein n=1 Tax=Rhodovibrio salinarum TaxID=1087 RepID=A0A934QGX7_9PROT|nr:MOSC domain-containing protein [Rhodovibrio salinarum]MBK1696679.1 MOSC domain-containing protein [Rhodovibrio salinarum]
MSTTGKIARLYRYPVKGLSADPLERTTVAAGGQIPHDRRFAIARPTTRIDTSDPQWMKKTHFHCLMRDARLAQLAAHYDADTTHLTLHRKGRQVSQAVLSDPMGRMMLGQFFAAFLEEEAGGTPKVVDAGTRVLSDQPTPVISIINLASLRDLERVTGRTVDPVRFRANLYLEGLPAWVERNWPGQRLQTGDVTLAVREEINRCAATEVNPETGERDMKVIAALKRGYDHINCGVFATVETGGDLAVGETITVSRT